MIPPQVQVLRTVRPKYACHHCEGSGDEDRPAVRVAPAPAALIPKGLASEGLLAYIATAKFCAALPLYRQERQFARLGVELSRRTMSDWMIAVATACEPLMAALQDKVRAGPKLQIDETTVQAHREPGRADTTLSCLWVVPGLLTAFSGRRGGCLGAVVASGTLFASVVTAAPRPPFPQPLAQFLELGARRLQLLFQPLLARYRLAVHLAVTARLPAQFQYLAPQLRHLAPARLRAATRTPPESSHISILDRPVGLCPAPSHP